MIAAFAISAVFGLIWGLLTAPVAMLGASLTVTSFSPIVLLWLPAMLAGSTMNLIGDFLPPDWGGMASVFVLCVIYSVLILLFLISIFNKISSKYRSKFLYLVLALALLLLFYFVVRVFKH